MRRIIVRVHPSSRKQRIDQLDDSTFAVYVTELPERNRANIAVTQALADYFDIPRSRIVIKAGHAARTKIVEIW